MSVKHIQKYYSEICNQYHAMIEELHDFEKEAETGLFEPERLDMIKQSIQPLKDNYERWSYMMFLLHQPNKKEKQKKYQKQNQQLIATMKKSNSVDAIIEENNQVIKNLDNQHNDR